MAETEAKQATIEPLRGEGQTVVLEMDSLRDVKFLNQQLVRFGIRNCSRVERYLELLDKVMEETEDERIVVAGSSVAVNALRACVGSLKKDVQQLTNNTQINIDARGNEALVAELKKQIPLNDRIALLEKLESGNGSNGKH